MCTTKCTGTCLFDRHTHTDTHRPTLPYALSLVSSYGADVCDVCEAVRSSHISWPSVHYQTGHSHKHTRTQIHIPASTTSASLSWPSLSPSPSSSSSSTHHKSSAFPFVVQLRWHVIAPPSVAITSHSHMRCHTRTVRPGSLA